MTDYCPGAASGNMRFRGLVTAADLVGQHGLTQEHVDTLLAPWRAVIGDPLAAPAGVSS